MHFDEKNPEISSLPIAPYLDEICGKLKSSPSHALVLTAETGAGKSTAVPVALLKHFSGKILMTEPRRLAAVAIADRVSHLLGEETGKTAGYSLHLESKKSAQTRLEVATEAILLRRLQSDPLLENLTVIVLDEFHERSIYSDLALAFLKETMQLRDDLYLIVMSATINYQSLVNYLGTEQNPAVMMKIPGRLFPVKIEYCDSKPLAQVVKDEVDNLTNVRSQKKVISTSSITASSASILVFLPGIYEIKKAKSELENMNLDAEILVLHSSVSLAEQRKVLSPSKESKLRVILSSAIAETSLTVPDVVTVIDSGLSRVNKIDLSTGMEKLVTEHESVFSADQRAGRAGRVQAGKCVRLWNKNDVRIQQNLPEILRSDLTQLVLECAAWGVSDKSKLNWLDSPSDSSWNAAKSLLENLECVDENGKITEKGKSVLSLGLNPRLACVALAVFASKKPLSLVTSFTEFKDASESRKKLFEEDLLRRLSRVRHSEQSFRHSERSEESQNPFLAGFPDRLAKLSEKSTDSSVYQFPSGRMAVLKRDVLTKKSLSDFPAWLIGVEVSAGETIGKIFSFETINQPELENFLDEHSKTQTKTEFSLDDKNQLKAKKLKTLSFGKIILKEKNVPIADSEYSSALCDYLKNQDFFKLPLDSQNQDKLHAKLIDKKTENFLLRVEFYLENSNSQSQVRTTTKPDNGRKQSNVIPTLGAGIFLSYKFHHLNELTNDWLLPFINSKNLTSETIYNALYWFLDGTEIDKKVPMNITLPNGRKVKVLYEKKQNKIQPTIEIIIQRIFGCFETPKILGVPVLLKLLSPASRPLQITDDLEHFWTTAWPEICKEMKGRYPKHNWDYKISS